MKFSLARLPLIIFRKLGRHAAKDEILMGWSEHPQSNTHHKVPASIEIDVRTTGRKRLEIIIHEALHLAFPAVPEEDIRRAGRYVGMVVWALGYRADEHEQEEKWYNPEEVKS